MGINRYIELKYNNKTYTESYLINEILIEKKFNWIIDAEIENARIEIFKDTLIWNAGTWISGTWEYGVFRNGEWRYGIWNGGVWYNGKWRDGIFNSGIINGGTFLNGIIKYAQINGGKFYDIEITSKEIKKIVKTEKTITENRYWAPRKKRKIKLSTLRKQFDKLKDRNKYNKMKSFDEFVESD